MEQSLHYTAEGKTDVQTVGAGAQNGMGTIMMEINCYVAIWFLIVLLTLLQETLKN